MQKIFYFAIILVLANSAIVSIGSCATYTSDGLQCQNCIENYHLFNGGCYSDITNCVNYKTGTTCQQCSNATILVSNSCLDSQSLQKMLASQSGNSQPFLVANNMDKIAQLVNFVESGFLSGSSGNLVAFDVRVYNQLWRWFLLYQFDSQFISNQRLIVDMDLNSSTFTAIDFSSLKNPKDFATMFWKDVDNESDILSEYSNYYSASEKYLKINVRKALVSEVNEFEIFTVTVSSLIIREVYSTKTGNVLLSEQIQNLLSSSPSVFQPYQLTFQGSEIDTEINIDSNLQSAVNLVKSNPSWNHTLTTVIESGNATNLTEFILIGQSTVTTFTGVVINNPLNGKVSLVKLTVEIISQDDSSSNSTDNHTFVEEDGCTIHTTFTPPFNGNLKNMADELLKLKTQKTLSGIPQQPESATPFIQGPGLVVRRIVVTSLCQLYNYRQVAYIEGDTVSTKEYFTYYLEENINTTKTWYYIGNKTKVQTSAVYSNPTAYPINYIDPSFNNYPYATLYDQLGVKQNYLANLSPENATLFITLAINKTTEIDRLMGVMQRFQVDLNDAVRRKYRAYGWKVYNLPDLFAGFRPFQSCLCDQLMITESFVIGSSLVGSSAAQTQQAPSIRGNLVRNDGH